MQLDIGEDSHDHLITPEERFNLAMAHNSDLAASPLRLDEHTLGLHGDALVVGEVAGGVGLDPVGPGDPRLGV